MNTPKFKEGDWIKSKKDGRIARVVMLLDTCYDLSLTDGDGWCLDYDFQDNWKLTDAPPKDASDKSLEEARLYSDNQDASDYPDLFSREDIKSAFIAGAEWQKEQMMKEQPEVDLENEIDNYYHDNLGFIIGPNDTKDIVSNIAKHFYELGKKAMEEQMTGLSIHDLELLHTFLYAVKNNKHGAFTFTRLSDEQYEEVLRRFNKAKDDKK